MASATMINGCRSHRGAERLCGTACRACLKTCGVRNCRTKSNRDRGCCKLRSFRAAFIAVFPPWNEWIVDLTHHGGKRRCFHPQNQRPARAASPDSFPSYSGKKTQGVFDVASDRSAQDRSKAKPYEVVQTPVRS